MSRTVAADVEVSVVSLRGGAVLERCLARLPRACEGIAWRLTLVDNSPLGLDLKRPLSEMSAADVIRSEGRRGFGANQNLALESIVRDRRARYVLIVNDDVELDPLSVVAMVDQADRHPRAGILGPRIRDAAGRHDAPFLAWPTLTNQAAQCAMPGREWKTPRTGGWITGACMLVRTQSLAAVGLFDARYFLFYEETDLCLRVARAGWTIEHCPDAGLTHYKHQTTTRAGSDIAMNEQLLRSRYLYFRKHRGRLAARSLNGVLRLAFLVRAGKAAVEARLNGRSGQASSPRLLWALAVSRPSRPTGFEIEARAGTDFA